MRYTGAVIWANLSGARLLKACCVVAVAGFASVPAVAQTEPGEVSAVTLRRLSLVNLTDLAFGGIIPGNGLSRVTINPSTDVRTSTGNATLVGSQHGAARFVSYGGPNILVTMGITGGNPTITRVGGTETMDVDQMTFNGPTVRVLNTQGFLDIRIGGRLTVKNRQEHGHYRGTFQFTINYF